jgi:CII-binding regulator of phage lambda lysogenization HflD
MELTRYVVALLGLERKLARQPELAANISAPASKT